MRGAIAQVLRQDLTAPGAAGDAVRAEAGKQIAALGNAENESFGIELGYVYHQSPVVCADPGAGIPDDPVRYIPTTAPGARLPSVILRDGTAIFDRLGPWFTLVCVGLRPSDPLVAAAAARGMPMEVLQLDDPHLTKIYGNALLLVRPDQHIAWRGSACEDRRTAGKVIARVLGWETSR